VGFLAAAFGVYLCCVLPWMFHNLNRFGSFSMGGNLGQNLFSRVVEYDRFIDDESTAIRDIRTTFEKDRQERRMDSAVKISHDWYNHWPTTHAYMRYHKVNEYEANRVLMQAALDGIRKYPFLYLGKTLEAIARTLASREITYLYIPALEKERSRNWPFSLMRNVHELNEFYENYDWVGADYLAVSETSNALTRLYSRLAGIYDIMVSSKILVFGLLIIQGLGLLACLTHAVSGPRRLEMLLLVGYLVYGLLLPLLVVPWYPRHRLPIDPVLCFLYFMPLFLVVDLVRARALRGRPPAYALSLRQQ
jgi:hypothetical protein